MVAPNEFWLQLHRLAGAYDAEGLNASQRTENIVAELRGMSPLAQRELVAELLRLAPERHRKATARCATSPAPGSYLALSTYMSMAEAGTTRPAHPKTWPQPLPSTAATAPPAPSSRWSPRLWTR